MVRNDDGLYDANFDALQADLGQIWGWAPILDYDDSVGDLVEEINPGLVVWYRGGPGSPVEQQSYTRDWTEAEIDNYLQVLNSGYPVLLVSQAHGYGKTAFHPSSYSSGWEVWYGYTLLNAQLQASQARMMWAHGMTGGRLTAGTGQFGHLASEPFALATGSAVGGKAPTDGYDTDGLAGAEFYSGPGSSGEVPIELSFGSGYQLCGLGYYSGLMLFDEHPVAAEGFCAGVNLSPAFEDLYDLAFVSWGNTAAPNRNMGIFSDGGPQINTADHGCARLWVIGYPWAQTEVISSDSGAMTRTDVLENILGWLMEGAINNFHEYAGKPEIVQVTVGQWADGGYEYGPPSRTWDGTAGDYPDQTADAGCDVNVYRSTPPDSGNYVVTNSPNNDWINGNDVDFQFPWYAFIVDVNGDGVQLSHGNNADDTVFFGGLLLEDPDSSWVRDLTLDYYSPAHSDSSVPSVVIDGFDPPVQVAGYYVSTQPDTGDEVRAYYGAAPASVTIDNDSEITAECVAHWPQDLGYGGFEYPAGSGEMLPVSTPVLYWSMYPGHNMTEPGTGLQIPCGTPDGWGAYRRAFDIDPSVSIAQRNTGSAWNRPEFAFHDAASGGRTVTFDYRQVPGWIPDLNFDGTIDDLDKFPVRVRLFTDHEDYLTWPTGWPDHLQDPGFDPELGGPIWDPDDPGFNIPDYIEGGAYIVDEGARVLHRMIIDDPSQPDPHELISGEEGDYDVTFNYLITGGMPNFVIDLQLGFDYNDIGPGESELDAFGNSGETHYAVDVYVGFGPHSSVININSLTEGEYYAAVRLTDNLGAQDVYVWPVKLVLPPDD